MSDCHWQDTSIIRDCYLFYLTGDSEDQEDILAAQTPNALKHEIR